MSAGDEDPGQLFLSDGLALFVGRVSDTSVHAHYAVQLTLALDNPFQLSTNASSEECSAAIVPSREPHAVRAPEGKLLLLYLDPTATPGEQVAASCKGKGVRTLRAAEVADCVADVRPNLTACSEPMVAQALVRRILSALAPGLPRESRVDPRIREVLALLDDEAAGPSQLPELAADVGLSPDRLRHLFAEQLGIPIRSYRSWARIRQAMTLLARGGSLTEVAHAANFADAAHLSRAFRDMFGITLSKLAKSQIKLH
ncbi:MAG: AraC family transcriptional regulator [Deltaproteobacteria bacterium]|nr:AraC family transcriptional regulator [Deltaproteobacteria bacterium]